MFVVQGIYQRSVNVDGLLKVRRWHVGRQRERKLRRGRQQRSILLTPSKQKKRRMILWMLVLLMILKVSVEYFYWTHKLIFHKQVDCSFLSQLISRLFAESQNNNDFHSSLVLLLCLSPEDSDYNPTEEDCKGRPPAPLKKPNPPISSSSHGRPRRKVGRPRKYSLLEEGYSNKGGFSVLIEQNKNELNKHRLQSLFFILLFSFFFVCYRSRKYG